jgi:hypothetical protein
VDIEAKKKWEQIEKPNAVYSVFDS